MSVLITTELLGENSVLTSVESQLDLTAAWIRSGDGLIGFGEYRKIEISGADRFKQARTWWNQQLSEFKIQNNVHGSGTGPILFTSFSFDPHQNSVLVIPEIILAKKGNKSWVTWIGDTRQPDFSRIQSTVPSGEISWAGGSISEDKWREQVTFAVKSIKEGRLEKVVLARDQIARSNQPINTRSILQRLEIDYPSTWLFLVDGLIGATPELLVRLSKSLVTSRVLAGTIQKTGNEDRDLALAASLAKSSKDLEEHEYAVRSVADALEPFCSSTNVPESPFVLATQADAFTLIEQLHPTAAVCGTPTEVAKQLINDLEKMNRGRYAAPVGWIDANGDGEIAIALRCGLLLEDKKSIRIFAGCGIVAGSDPETEFAESQAKLMPMRTALEML